MQWTDIKITVPKAQAEDAEAIATGVSGGGIYIEDYSDLEEQVERIAHVEQLLSDYGLEKFKNKRPCELSGGMKQRAALIRTLALDPQLLLLDEPFSALDYQTRLMVSSDICQLIRKAGKTMIIVTHDLSEAISLADKVYVLSARPATIKTVLPIQLTLTDSSPLAARNAPEFPYYFKKLWEELTDET